MHANVQAALSRATGAFSQMVKNDWIEAVHSAFFFFFLKQLFNKQVNYILQTCFNLIAEHCGFMKHLQTHFCTFTFFFFPRKQTCHLNFQNKYLYRPKYARCKMDFLQTSPSCCTLLTQRKDVLNERAVRIIQSNIDFGKRPWLFPNLEEVKT